MDIKSEWQRWISGALLGKSQHSLSTQADTEALWSGSSTAPPGVPSRRVQVTHPFPSHSDQQELLWALPSKELATKKIVLNAFLFFFFLQMAVIATIIHQNTST